MSLFLSALLIFLLRVGDQTLASMRIVMLVSGRRALAGILGFFEALLWVVATAQVLTNMDDPIKLVAFAAGFATGNMVGGTIERWLALGKSLIRVVTPNGTPTVVDELRQQGYGATVLHGIGITGDVEIVFSVVPRKQVSAVMQLVHRINPDAFVTAEGTETPELARFRRRMVRN